MTEQEYIDMTNLTKVASALQILRGSLNMDRDIMKVCETLRVKFGELHAKTQWATRMDIIRAISLMQQDYENMLNEHQEASKGEMCEEEI